MSSAVSTSKRHCKSVIPVLCVFPDSASFKKLCTKIGPYDGLFGEEGQTGPPELWSFIECVWRHVQATAKDDESLLFVPWGGSQIVINGDRRQSITFGDICVAHQMHLSKLSLQLS